MEPMDSQPTSNKQAEKFYDQSAALQVYMLELLRYTADSLRIRGANDAETFANLAGFIERQIGVKVRRQP